MSKRSTSILLNDMLDAVKAIALFTENMDYEAFIDDRKTKDAVVRNIQVVGEAANRIPESYRLLHPDVEWMRIIRSRHIVVHDYFGIDYEIVWRIVTIHLPQLQQTLELLLSTESD